MAKTAKSRTKKQAAQDMAALSFRVDRNLYELLKNEAVRNSRSVAMETVHRLKQTLQAAA